MQYGKMHATKLTDLRQDLHAKTKSRGAKLQNIITAQHSKRTRLQI